MSFELHLGWWFSGPSRPPANLRENLLFFPPHWSLSLAILPPRAAVL